MKQELYVCPFCGRVCKRKGDLTQHIKYCKNNPDRVEHPQTGKKASTETRQKLSKSLTGRKLTNEHKQHIKDNHAHLSGENNPMYGKEPWNKNIQLTDEHKQKISDITTQLWQNSDYREKVSNAIKISHNHPEVKQKMSESHTGKTLSEEHKQKISSAGKKRYEDPKERQKQSDMSKKLWEDPVIRQKITESLNRPEYKQRMIELLNSPEVRQKSYNTKKQNNSFHTSKIEERLKEYLISHNINFRTQYKSDVYPFMCDFYFPDSDLYVEIQGSWTHGFKPYDSEDIDCIRQLELWKLKNTKYYDNAIETWSVRDVKKRNIAKQNNLNYLEIFSIDLEECIQKISEQITI